MGCWTDKPALRTRDSSVRSCIAPFAADIWRRPSGRPHQHTFFEDPTPTGQVSCACGQLAMTVVGQDGEEGIQMIPLDETGTNPAFAAVI